MRKTPSELLLEQGLSVLNRPGADVIDEVCPQARHEGHTDEDKGDTADDLDGAYVPAEETHPDHSPG